MRRICISLLLWVVPVALAQRSTNYTLEEHVLNEGGRPLQGVVMNSTNYRVTFDGIGGDMTGSSGSCWGPLATECYTLGSGFGASFPPPGEVQNLRLTNQETLTWWAEKSAGTYNLYRSLITYLAAGDYGRCEQRAIADTFTYDPGYPPPGDGFFYLVTVKNRLAEEGTKGHDSAGHERPNPEPCP